MRRDINLIRLLLLEYEGVEHPDLSEYSEDQKLYHTGLLIEADLVNGATAKDENGCLIAAEVVSLSWKGHDFLDAARDSTIWRKATAKLKDGVIFDVLFELLKKLSLEALGL